MSDQQREQYKQMAQDADAVGTVLLELPIKALRNLQEVWESGVDDVALYETVLRDLFGGQDGHLYLLDEHLGCPEARL